MAEDNHNKSKGPGGYGKPPKSGQFKPGQSGNPSGKKKGKGLLQYIAEVGEEEKTFVQGGKQVTMPADAALAQKLFSDALKGKPQAAKIILDAQKSVSGDGPFSDDILAGAEEFEVARSHADWLKLIEAAKGGHADDDAPK